MTPGEIVLHTPLLLHKILTFVEPLDIWRIRKVNKACSQLVSHLPQIKASLDLVQNHQVRRIELPKENLKGLHLFKWKGRPYLTGFNEKELVIIDVQKPTGRKACIPPSGFQFNSRPYGLSVGVHPLEGGEIELLTIVYNASCARRILVWRVESNETRLLAELPGLGSIFVSGEGGLHSFGIGSGISTHFGLFEPSCPIEKLAHSLGGHRDLQWTRRFFEYSFERRNYLLTFSMGRAIIWDLNGETTEPLRTVKILGRTGLRYARKHQVVTTHQGIPYFCVPGHESTIHRLNLQTFELHTMDENPKEELPTLSPFEAIQKSIGAPPIKCVFQETGTTYFTCGLLAAKIGSDAHLLLIAKRFKGSDRLRLKLWKLTDEKPALTSYAPRDEEMLAEFVKEIQNEPMLFLALRNSIHVWHIPTLTPQLRIPFPNICALPSAERLGFLTSRSKEISFELDPYRKVNKEVVLIWEPGSPVRNISD